MPQTKDPREWTVIFYFAGDNKALAHIVVSHLKAIKDAGFQKNTDVLVYFDPNELGAPTRIFDVNRKRKKNPRLAASIIGDAEDPFVHNLKEDEVEPEMIDPGKGPASAAMREALKKPDDIDAKTALENFLGFCRESHPANHYILFLYGHGMVVGNDTFLPDDNPVSGVALKDLGTILHGFTDAVKTDKSSFELLALHSCSMSAIEVAYQLKGTASYMIASEGPSVVNSWPYRQLLKKIFNTVEDPKPTARQEAEKGDTDQDEAERIAELVEKLYFLTLHNATDFQLAGFSHDLALCSLDKKKYDKVTEAIQKLVTMLNDGLKASNGVTATKRGKRTKELGPDGSEINELDEAVIERGKRIKELVLLSHWEAQSYWEENYTDLIDFCLCLSRRCDGGLADLREACENVMNKLKSKDRSKRFQAPIIHSRHSGSLSQYSQGLSIYFPWSRPIETIAKGSKDAKTGDKKKSNDEGILERYKEYQFTTELKELGGDTWFDFLESYFKETQRQSRNAEDKTGSSIASAVVDAPDRLLLFGKLPGVLLDRKPSPILKASPIVGAECTCPSIKNYPLEIEEAKSLGAK